MTMDIETKCLLIKMKKLKKTNWMKFLHLLSWLKKRKRGMLKSKLLIVAEIEVGNGRSEEENGIDWDKSQRNRIAALDS